MNERLEEINNNNRTDECIKQPPYCFFRKQKQFRISSNTETKVRRHGFHTTPHVPSSIIVTILIFITITLSIISANENHYSSITNKFMSKIPVLRRWNDFFRYDIPRPSQSHLFDERPRTRFLFSERNRKSKSAETQQSVTEMTRSTQWYPTPYRVYKCEGVTVIYRGDKLKCATLHNAEESEKFMKYLLNGKEKNLKRSKRTLSLISRLVFGGHGKGEGSQQVNRHINGQHRYATAGDNSMTVAREAVSDMSIGDLEYIEPFKMDKLMSTCDKIRHSTSQISYEKEEKQPVPREIFMRMNDGKSFYSNVHSIQNRENRYTNINKKYHVYHQNESVQYATQKTTMPTPLPLTTKTTTMNRNNSLVIQNRSGLIEDATFPTKSKGEIQQIEREKEEEEEEGILASLISTGSLKSWFIFPGTKWCGWGNITDENNGLGFYKEEDLCCRTHDICVQNHEFIKRGECKLGICNPSSIAVGACKCDEAFKRCLHETRTRISYFIGQAFFNVAQMSCIRYDHPVQKCEKQADFPRNLLPFWVLKSAKINLRPGTKGCSKYEYDYTKPKQWQTIQLHFEHKWRNVDNTTTNGSSPDKEKQEATLLPSVRSDDSNSVKQSSVSVRRPRFQKMSSFRSRPTTKTNERLNYGRTFLKPFQKIVSQTSTSIGTGGEGEEDGGNELTWMDSLMQQIILTFVEPYRR